MEGTRIDVGSEPPSVSQSQTEFEAFFDLALDLMAIAGFDGCIRRVNAAYERTLGYPVRELLSRPFLDTVHPEDVPRVRDLFGELVDGDRDDVIGFENRVICGDGSVRWLQWNTRTVPERGVVFAVGRDVTDRRRAEAGLREAQRTVEASRDELARLAEEHAALRGLRRWWRTGRRRMSCSRRSSRRSSACCPARTRAWSATRPTAR